MSSIVGRFKKWQRIIIIISPLIILSLVLGVRLILMRSSKETFNIERRPQKNKYLFETQQFHPL